jgi:hypothetical protein
MGCGKSKACPATPAEAEKPKPQVFAIMRNGHEVLRGSLRDCDEYLQNGDKDKFAAEFRSAMKWQGIHAKMEDGAGPYKGFFPILNEKIDNICKEKGLMDAHDELEKLEASIEEAINGGDIEAIKAAYAKFSPINEKHYKDEEAIMMPKVKAMMEAKENLKKMIQEHLLPLAIEDDFQFFVEFALRTLEKHHENMPRARVFAHALWAVATTEQWSLWEPWVEKSLSPPLFAEIKGLITA